MHRPPAPAKQMAYLYPRFYNCSVPATFLADLPQLAQLCEGNKPPLASDKRVEQLFSARGDKFISFAKSAEFVDGKTFVMYCCSFIYSLFRHLVAPLLLYKFNVLQSNTFFDLFGTRWSYTTTFGTWADNLYLLLSCLPQPLIISFRLTIISGQASEEYKPHSRPS